MDLRCIFLSLCIFPLSVIAQVFQFNQNLHQALTADIIDFGYRQAPVGAKKGFLKRFKNLIPGKKQP